MKYALSSQCKKQLQMIRQRDDALYKKINQKLHLFAQNPNHKSLRLHKLSGSQSDAWSISINRSMRMLFVYRVIQSSGEMERQVIFFIIGRHEEVYK